MAGAQVGVRQHVVVTADNSAGHMVYKNATLIGQSAVSVEAPDWDHNQRFGLGDAVSGEPDRFWIGTYHRVALYDRVLTAQEIMALYENPPLVCAGDCAQTQQ